MNPNETQIPNQPHNSESLLNVLIGLAMRTHTDRCEHGMDSRLRCTCGADLHNAKVQGSAIGLRKAMYDEMIPNNKPQVAQPKPITIPVSGAPMEEKKEKKTPPFETPMRFETGTSIPGIAGNIPFAKEQPVSDSPNTGAPAGEGGSPPKGNPKK